MAPWQSKHVIHVMWILSAGLDVFDDRILLLSRFCNNCLDQQPKPSKHATKRPACWACLREVPVCSRLRQPTASVTQST